MLGLPAHGNGKDDYDLRHGRCRVRMKKLYAITNPNGTRVAAWCPTGPPHASYELV